MTASISIVVFYLVVRTFWAQTTLRQQFVRTRYISQCKIPCHPLLTNDKWPQPKRSWTSGPSIFKANCEAGVLNLDEAVVITSGVCLKHPDATRSQRPEVQVKSGKHLLTVVSCEKIRLPALESILYSGPLQNHQKNTSLSDFPAAPGATCDLCLFLTKWHGNSGPRFRLQQLLNRPMSSMDAMVYVDPHTIPTMPLPTSWSICVKKHLSSSEAKHYRCWKKVAHIHGRCVEHHDIGHWSLSNQRLGHSSCQSAVMVIRPKGSWHGKGLHCWPDAGFMGQNNSIVRKVFERQPRMQLSPASKRKPSAFCEAKSSEEHSLVQLRDVYIWKTIWL